jgi:hypothetical protein
MEKEKVIPFNSPEGREITNQLRGRVGPTPANLPAGPDRVIPFDSPEGRQISTERFSPQREYSWSEVLPAARQNLPGSARQFYGDVATAVLNPIDTAVATAQLAGGAAMAALPEGARNWLMSVGNNPERMQQSIDMARAAGGQLADRYGTMAGFRRALAEDPVSVAADFSTLLSGGAGATARIAPTASRTLQSAADFTNPLLPMAALSEAKVPLTDRTVGQNLSVAGGTLWDAVTGNAGERVARNIITAALGEQNIPTIAQLTDPRTRNMPAGEAVLAAGVNRPQFQALARNVAEPDPQNLFFQQEQAAQAQRQGLLSAVTPDLEQATTARSAVTDPMFRQTRVPPQPVNTQPILENIDRIIQENVGNKALVSAMNTVREGVQDSTNSQQLSSVVSSINALLDSKENKFIRTNLNEVKRQVVESVPGLQEARQTFAEMSAPVNQAQVLREMQARLTGPLDAERPGQFMRVLGQGEEALIKSRTGTPIFQEGDLMRMLTEEQGRAVTEVSDQLRRQAEMTRQADRGRAGLLNILEENRPLGARIPNVLNRTVMIANRTLNLLEGRVSKATQSALENAMLSGENLSTFINSRPITERGLIRDALNAANEAANIDQFRNLGVIEQLTEEEQPFRAELRGMAR